MVGIFRSFRHNSYLVVSDLNEFHRRGEGARHLPFDKPDSCGDNKDEDNNNNDSNDTNRIWLFPTLSSEGARYLPHDVPDSCGGDDDDDNNNNNQRTNGPVNAHLISWPSKAQNIQNLENIL